MALQKVLKDINKSADVVILVGGRPLAGQQGAVLNQHRDSINITNKITPEWSENLVSTRSWNVHCSGVYVLNQESLTTLQTSFMENAEVQVSLTVNGIEYAGKALITDFPVNTAFNQSLKYNVTLLGTGPLTKVE